MSYPAGIIRREVTFGVPFSIADGADLVMVVTFTPTRSMVWGAAGAPGIARQYTAKTLAGLQGSQFLPVTDQSGWLDGIGGALSVANGAQTHGYLVSTRLEDIDGTFIADLPSRNIALPAGDLTAVDLDTTIPVSTVGGVTISVPDSWSQAVAAAQAAAVAATTQSVGGFLSGNMPNPGVNQAAFSNAMLARAPIRWQPNTAYAIGTQVLAPDGSTVQAIASFTSGATFNAANWSVVVASAASLSATYATKDQLAAAGGGQVLTQSSPSASWTFSHSLGRIPNVAVYSTAGDQIVPDVHASSTSVSLTFANPMAGTAVLT